MFIFSVSTFPSSSFLSPPHRDNNPWVAYDDKVMPKESQADACDTHMKTSRKEIRDPDGTFCPNTGINTLPPRSPAPPSCGVRGGNRSSLKASRIIKVDPRKNFTLERKAIREAADLRTAARLTLAAAPRRPCLAGRRHAFRTREIFISPHVFVTYILEKQLCLVCTVPWSRAHTQKGI